MCRQSSNLEDYIFLHKKFSYSFVKTEK